ncbi:hypothetical protein WAF17_02905 [Bernardetia sp. ABR2-2B]|uniref:hypothetical protein n=1 Tax=Bernardetia sp. ABR2-2B TaxID=3127472 RepID=UPI0030CF902F
MNTPDKKQDKNTDSSQEFFKDKFDYDPKEDIYNQGKKVTNIDNNKDLIVDKGIPTPNDSNKLHKEVPLHNAESNFEGETIDVPGAELDNQQESIGSEDEENNYYSLGGDNHSN